MPRPAATVPRPCLRLGMGIAVLLCLPVGEVVADERVAAAAPDATRGGDASDSAWDLFWAELHAGYSFSTVDTLDTDGILPRGLDASASGVTAGLGAGLRLGPVTVGITGSGADHAAFQIANIGLETAAHLPYDGVQPYARIGVGVAWLDGLALGTRELTEELSVRGIAAELGVGADVRMTGSVAVGIGIDAVLLELERRALDGCNVSYECNLDGVDLGTDADTTRFQLRIKLRLRYDAGA